MMVHTFNSNTLGDRLVDLCEYEASLIYIVKNTSQIVPNKIKKQQLRDTVSQSKEYD